MFLMMIMTMLTIITKIVITIIILNTLFGSGRLEPVKVRVEKFTLGLR